MSLQVVDAVPQELAATANQEYALAVRATHSVIEHAIRAGDALLQIKEHVRHGEWVRWLETNFDGGVSTAHQFIRVAIYKDQIPDGVGWSQANELLRGKPGTGNRPIWRHDPELQARAVRLYRKGNKTLAEVAESVGVVPSTVHNWVKRDERLQRDEIAAAAVAQRERDRLVRKHGGAIAEAYSLTRKLAQVLDRASGETEHRDVLQLVHAALAGAHAVEDNIVRAVRLS